MIKRIDRLQNFGIYRDFNGNEESGLSEFKKFNLIYGWNYSGKTTISRLFHSLQFPERDIPFECAQFQVLHEDATHSTHTTRECPYPVRVFNSDFIERNFQNEHTAPAVFMVGEENLSLRQRRDTLRSKQAEFIDRSSSKLDEAQSIQEQINEACTNYARNVREALGVTNFIKPTIEAHIRQIKDLPHVSTLSEEIKQAHINTFRTGDHLLPLSLQKPTYPRLDQEAEAVDQLLQRTASYDAIAGLKDQPDLELWIQNGMGLHAIDESTCKFCGNSIPSERLDALKRHFSQAYTELLKEVDENIERLGRLDLQAPVIDPAYFIESLRPTAREKLRSITNWLEQARLVRDILVQALQNKRTSLEAPVTVELPEFHPEQGPTLVDALWEEVNTHNDHVENIGETKANSRTAIEKHYAATLIIEEALTEKESQILTLKNRAHRSEQAAARMCTAADVIDTQIDRTTRGAERFMQLVAFFLKGSDIQVESYQETEFRLMRGVRQANRLSEGEKTAIAFAYFITTLEGDDEDLENTIVYIDDPISSLDSNHVYAVYALITKKLANARQVFVSTHNSEFFSLLKNFWLNPHSNIRKKSRGYYIRRLSNATCSFSQLEDLPELLKKYSSEYEFIYAQLKAFADNQTPSEHEIYTAPNLLRRFLEAYLGFRRPHISAWHAKLDILIDCEETRSEIQKLLDDASHLQRMDRALHEPSFAPIAHDCVKQVLSGLQDKDLDHYNSLQQVITPNRSGE